MNSTAGRIRLVIAGAAAAGMLVGGTATWFATRPAGNSATAGQTLTYTVATSNQQTTVGATGTFAPIVTDSLSFQQSGTINRVRVAVGDKVTKGETLASIGSANLRQALTSARATLTADESSLSSLEGTSGTTGSQLASAQAQMASAVQHVTVARQSLAQANLTSPVTGEVAAVNIQVGDQAGSGSSSGSSSDGSNAGSTSTSSSAAADIVVFVPGRWQVNTTVGASDLPNIKPGMQAQMTPTGATRLVFGTVSSVGVMGTSSGGSAAFPVVIKVTGKPSGLYIGGTTTVSIITRQLNNILTIPTAALSQSNGAVSVTKLANGQPQVTTVTIGQNFGRLTQVTSGLQAGDQITYTERSFAGTASTSGGNTFGGLGSFGGRTGGGNGGGTGQGQGR